MKSANVAEFKKHLSSYLELVESGETVEICRRNVPIAEVRGKKKSVINRTKLGSGLGSVRFLGSVTDTFMAGEDWEMLSSEDV
jgi:antitoxin (DNA-binding transcriptional repressor) of toxin-antitoxin stability system